MLKNCSPNLFFGQVFGQFWGPFWGPNPLKKGTRNWMSFGTLFPRSNEGPELRF